MDDYVSRKAVIDAVKFAEEGIWGWKGQIAEAVKALPSEQPEFAKRTSKTVQNVPNSDLISRKEAIDALCSRCAIDKPETCSTIQKGDGWCDEVYTILNLPSAQPEYYDYSDIDPLWKSFAEENDINLTETAKQLKDAMWCGYRKGKADAEPESYKEKLNEIANALSEKFAYMNTCLNERDIILGYLGVKRSCETHCYTDCTNTKCKSHPSSAQPEIIRCKDCLIHGVCKFEQWLGLNGYCSKAERREDG